MGKYANIQLVKEGKIFFLTIIFKNLFRIDLPKSAGGIFFFFYVFTYYIWILKWKRQSCIQYYQPFKSCQTLYLHIYTSVEMYRHTTSTWTLGLFI